MDEALQRYGSALGALQAELDWQRLGRSYCEGDGTDFFDEELRQSILERGMQLAEDVSRALGEARGKSLYLGAEVAELPLILAEELLLGRRVEWLNLECDATAELARALDAVGARLGLELPRPSARSPAEIEPASCDHLWMVSVLTDPDHFPALHDRLYQRSGGPLATGRGALDEERRRAEALIELWLERASARCVLCTSDEERELVEPLVARRGWELAFAPGGRLSAIVGDRVRIGELRRPGGESRPARPARGTSA